MDTILKKNLFRTLVLAVCLSASAGVSAHGWGGGGWHGGGWHGGGWHGGGWHGGGWGGGWNGGGLVIGAPAYYGSYYGCQRVRVCNYRGYCWIQRSCY